MTCSCQNNVKPTIVPAVEVKQPVKHSLEVIGAVENIYVLPMKVPFPARIDTGAETSSIDVGKFKTFERDGEKWVSFDLDHNGTGEKLHLKRKSNAEPLSAESTETNIASSSIWTSKWAKTSLMPTLRWQTGRSSLIRF